MIIIAPGLNCAQRLWIFFCLPGRIKQFILYLCPKLFVIAIVIHPRFLFANKVIRYCVVVCLLSDDFSKTVGNEIQGHFRGRRAVWALKLFPGFGNRLLTAQHLAYSGGYPSKKHPVCANDTMSNSSGSAASAERIFPSDMLSCMITFNS